MFYSLIRKFLFTLDPETAHAFSLKTLRLASQLGLTRFFVDKVPAQPKTVMGLSFPNPIGLSAGFDRNGDYINALAALGFGFIEIGTVIPSAQPGNPRPRVFRIPQHEAIINRMGFASKGLDYVIERLAQTRYQGILGINIGKRKDTPNTKAIEDYTLGFRSLAHYASYITINISSPNTQGLRDLLKPDYLVDLLKALKLEQQHFLATQKKYVPLVIKISPDLTHQEIIEVANSLLVSQVDGVIASNTTLSRDGIAINEAGGLSGRPLFARNKIVIKTLAEQLQERIPIIASGGIMDENSAQLAMQEGASLLQIYTGLIYQGPGLIKRLAKVVAMKENL